MYIVEEELEGQKNNKITRLLERFVDVESISVQLQPIGAHQDV